MLKFLSKKRGRNISDVAQREFDYRFSLKVSQGAGCMYKENSSCTTLNLCPFKQERQCKYNRFGWLSLKIKIMEYKVSLNEELKKNIEKEIERLKEHKLKAWEYFNEKFHNYQISKQKV